jgi:PAS domain S-box-containing protein
MQLAGGTKSRRKIASTFVGVGCLLVVSVAVAYIVGMRALQLNRELSRESNVMRKVERFVSALKDTETGQRGYLLTGDEEYLKPYNVGRGEVSKATEELQRFGASGDLPAAGVQQLRELADKKLAELEKTIKLRREGEGQAAVDEVRSGRGRELMDEIRTLAGKMRDQKEAEFGKATERANQAVVVRTITFIATAVVNLAFLAWAYGRLRRAGDEIEREKELLATTLTSIGDGVVVTDPQARVTLVNPEAERITGWAHREAYGKELSEIFNIANERTGQRQENPIDKVLRLGRVVGLANHTVLLRKDGRKVPIGDSGAPVRRGDGPIEGAVLVFRDVTEEREAQLAKERLATIVETSDDAIISKTLDGTIQTWNSGAERIFGYTAKEAIGQPITILIPDERLDEETFIQERMKRGERVDHFETVRLTKDGRPIDVSVAVSPLKDEEGQVVGASKVLRDITVRKKAEKKLQEARAQVELHAQELESTVSERTRQLQGTVAELESFCYSLSHDMRTPLRAIQSYSQLVLQEEGNRLGTDCTGYLAKAISAAERMDQLIQDVLAFAKLSRQEITLEPIDVDKLLREIVQERPELQPGKADIRIESPLRKMSGHSASLTQCVTNLLDNAVKFVGPGVRPRVRVFSEANNGRVRLCFEDNGIGIEKEAQRRLFEMFQRMHTSTEYEGTGIGLAIVRKSAERMGGKVGLESEVGRGSRFWVELEGVDS